MADTLVVAGGGRYGGGGVLWLRRCKQEVARTRINDIQLHCVSLAKPLIRARSAALQNKHNSEIINPLTYQLGVVSVYTNLHHYFFFSFSIKLYFGSFHVYKSVLDSPSLSL